MNDYTKFFDGLVQVTSTDDLSEICAACGCTFGSHHAGQSPWPFNYCPGHEGRMDWENGPGTTFVPSGKYKEDDE